MATATTTKPRCKTARKASDKERVNKNVENKNEENRVAPEACENCRTNRKKKKKPMNKIGCWRGMFKGTPDF